LAHGGLRGLPDRLLRAVAQVIRGEGPLSSEAWETLKRRTVEEGFGQFNDAGDLVIYRPYLERCVLYEPTLQDMEQLVDVLDRDRNVEGLDALGAAGATSLAEPALAERALRAALRHGHAPSAVLLSFIALQSPERFGEAESLARQAIAASVSAGHVVLGLALARQPGREAEAEAAFRTAIAEGTSGDVTTAWFNLGNLLLRLPGRQADAEHAFRAGADRDDPLSLSALTGLLAYASGREADAEAALRRFLEAAPESETFLGYVKRAHLLLGLMLFDRGGDDDTAAEHLTQGLEMRPRLFPPGLQEELQRLEGHAREYLERNTAGRAALANAAAQRLAERWNEIGFDSSLLSEVRRFEAKALFHAEMGSADEALSHMRLAVALAGQLPDPHIEIVATLNFGVLHYRLKRYPDARAAFASALDLIEAHTAGSDLRALLAGALLNLGRTEAVCGDIAAARHNLERARGLFAALGDRDSQHHAEWELSSLRENI
jgi:tetratricopeptide (TPR) repeat protein